MRLGVSLLVGFSVSVVYRYVRPREQSSARPVESGKTATTGKPGRTRREGMQRITHPQRDSGFAW